MENKRVTLELPEGNFITTVSQFTNEDASSLKTIYESWRTLCGTLAAMNARAVNLPEGLSEIAFSIAKGVWRCTNSIPGANSSLTVTTQMAVEEIIAFRLKLAAFCQFNFVWPKFAVDRIYFVDFYREGNWDGTFDIYEIDTNDIKITRSMPLKPFQINKRKAVDPGSAL